MKDSDSGKKDPYEGEDSDHHITTIRRNQPQNSYKSKCIRNRNSNIFTFHGANDN